MEEQKSLEVRPSKGFCFVGLAGENVAGGERVLLRHICRAHGACDGGRVLAVRLCRPQQQPGRYRKGLGPCAVPELSDSDDTLAHAVRLPGCRSLGRGTGTLGSCKRERAPASACVYVRV